MENDQKSSQIVNPVVEEKKEILENAIKETELDIKKWEINLSIVNFIWEILKCIALAIGAVIVYFTITSNDSFVNKQNSEEAIKRERAKLVLDLINQNTDPQKVVIGLDIIKSAYPKDKDWIEEVEKMYKEKARYADITDLKKNREERLSNKHDLEVELNSNKANSSSEATFNSDPETIKIKKKINNLNIEISEIESKLNNLNVPIPNAVNK